ncbi:MAG: ribosome assembly cofactor RimP [Bacteroidales bacterium]|nr:ribosome assembly cofactor RimP [Bacteroidales bacterium]
MLDRNAILDFVSRQIEGTDLFPVDVTVSPDNVIVVELDGPAGVDIDTCVNLSRAFEEEFPREPEDYELEVGGAGLTAPFKVLGQYLKNIGREIEVLTADSRKLKGTLTAADADAITLRREVKVKVEGKKKPVIEEQEERIPMADIRKAQLILNF